jgi:hypothetical protein
VSPLELRPEFVDPLTAALPLGSQGPAEQEW